MPPLSYYSRWDTDKTGTTHSHTEPRRKHKGLPYILWSTKKLESDLESRYARAHVRYIQAGMQVEASVQETGEHQRIRWHFVHADLCRSGTGSQ